MELLIGALAVLFVLVVIEALPWHMTTQNELVLIALESVGAAFLLYDAFDKSVVADTLAIAGLTIALRAAYRLLRAWADEREITALLRARGR